MDPVVDAIDLLNSGATKVLCMYLGEESHVLVMCGEPELPKASLGYEVVIARNPAET